MPQHSPNAPPSPSDRRAAGVVCAHLAVRLVNYLLPHDGRLRAVLAVVEPLLLETVAPTDTSRRALDSALQTACDCGAEAQDPAVSVAADALAALCTAALAQHDGQPSSLVALFAGLACSHAAAARDLAAAAAPSARARGTLTRALTPLRPAFEAALAQWPVRPTDTWAPSPPFPSYEQDDG
ncbi:MAG: hypothetical protein NVSMB65_07990 [Chloroflexota bacterium]